MKVKYTSLAIIFISLVIFGLCLFNYFVINQKKNAIFFKLLKDKCNMAAAVYHCQSIASIKRSYILVDENLNSNCEDRIQKDQSELEFFIELNSNIEELVEKYMDLNTTKADYLERHRIARDEITNEVLVGNDYFNPMPCSGYDLLINSSKLKWQRSGKYILPKSKNVEIEYHKFRVDYREGKVDTFKLKRNISLE